MTSHIGIWRTNLKLQVWHYVISVLLCSEPEERIFGKEGGVLESMRFYDFVLIGSDLEPRDKWV